MGLGTDLDSILARGGLMGGGGERPRATDKSRRKSLGAALGKGGGLPDYCGQGLLSSLGEMNTDLTPPPSLPGAAGPAVDDATPLGSTPTPTPIPTPSTPGTIAPTTTPTAATATVLKNTTSFPVKMHGTPSRRRSMAATPSRAGGTGMGMGTGAGNGPEENVELFDVRRQLNAALAERDLAKAKVLELERERVLAHKREGQMENKLVLLQKTAKTLMDLAKKLYDDVGAARGRA